MTLLCLKIITFLIIISTFNNLAISLLDREFGSFSTCTDNVLTKANSSYQNYLTSVSSLLSNLDSESQPPIPAFFTTTAGSSRGKAYASYMCWAGVTPQLCQQCVHYLTNENLKIGFISTDCFGFGQYLTSEVCVIRYANHSVNEYEDNFAFTTGNPGGKVVDYKTYNRTLSTTIEGLIKEAGYGNWTRTNFATRVVPVKGSQDKIHVLVQCTPVISAKSCSRCLQKAYDKLPKYFNGVDGGEIVIAYCILKFSNHTLVGGA